MIACVDFYCIIKLCIVQMLILCYNILTDVFGGFIMIKRPDTGTRKKLRIAMCAMYLLQIVFCTFPFIHYISAEGKASAASPFFMVFMLFGMVANLTQEMTLYCALSIGLIVIPVAGFFFCALDKEFNMKNIASVLCCVLGVYLTLVVSRRAISFGAVFTLLFYVILMLLTTFAMVMRLSRDDDEKQNDEKKSLR